MSGQCLCSWCVEARVRALHASVVALDAGFRARVAGERARAMREARERAGATCP